MMAWQSQECGGTSKFTGVTGWGAFASADRPPIQAVAGELSRLAGSASR